MFASRHHHTHNIFFSWRHHTNASCSKVMINNAFSDPTKWNKWYFPTGRIGPPYNLMDIEESLVAQTFKAFNFPVPSYNRILKLRQRLNINCTLPCDSAVGFTPDCGNKYILTFHTCMLYLINTVWIVSKY